MVRKFSRTLPTIIVMGKEQQKDVGSHVAIDIKLKSDNSGRTYAHQIQYDCNGNIEEFDLKVDGNIAMELRTFYATSVHDYRAKADVTLRPPTDPTNMWVARSWNFDNVYVA